MAVMCWRHRIDLYTAAFGSLLDLRGVLYVRWCKRIFAEVHECPACQARAGRA